MDVQIKKGILDACVLAAVFKQDSYGYKILQDLSGRISLSESTLYPILRRLEAAGCLHPTALRPFSVYTTRFPKATCF